MKSTSTLPPLDRVISRGIDEKFFTQFREYYYKLDPFLKRVLLTPYKTVLNTEPIISFKNLIRSEYYNDFLKPQPIHYQMSIVLKSEHQFSGVLSLFRPRNTNNFSSRDKSKAELMAPYLAKALGKTLISDKMMEYEPIIDSIVTDLPYVGAMVIDASLEPIYQNE